MDWICPACDNKILSGRVHTAIDCLSVVRGQRDAANLQIREMTPIVRSFGHEHPRWEHPTLGIQDPVGVHAVLEKYDPEWTRPEKPIPDTIVLSERWLEKLAETLENPGPMAPGLQKLIEKRLRDDLPVCGTCQGIGKLCDYHAPKVAEKRKEGS